MGTPSESPTFTRYRPRRRGLTVLVAVLAVAGVVAGTFGLVIESQPWLRSYYFGGLPCLLDLGSGRLGLVFVNFDLSEGGVYYAILDPGGGWILLPTAVTPLQQGTVGPSEAMARVDGAGRVHIAYSLWDPDRGNLSFYYAQVDAASGRVLHSVGPLGSLFLSWIYTDHPPGLAVDGTGAWVAWPADASEMQALGPTPGPWRVAHISEAGALLGPPTEVAQIDNASFFLPRALPPGGAEPVDSPASYVVQGATTFRVWTHDRIWYTSAFGPFAAPPAQPRVHAESAVYHQATDFQFQRAGPEGVANVTLLSTQANWWMERPWVAPASVALVAGGTTLALLAAFRARDARQRRVPPPPTAP